MATVERAEEVIKFADEACDAAAEAKYNVSHETLRRYRRQVKQMKDESETITLEPSTERLINAIRDRYSLDELKVLAQGQREKKRGEITLDWFDGDTFRFGVMTDTHFGSKFFREDWYEGALAKFEEREVEFIIHAGDVTEGLSNRAGHVYECSHIGYTAQKKEAERQLTKTDIKKIIISGNHDRWFMKSAGANIVEDICTDIGAVFLGDDEGIISIAGINIMAWHGEDGAAYALSYRVQKIVESLSGGKKPNILITGHDHKQGYFFTRNVQVIMGGCMQEQTPYMRGKRLAAHPGFWIITVTVNDGSIVEFAPTFFPYYE